MAKDLLGKVLARKIGEYWVTGRIVETEAYHQDDPAAHSFTGVTERTKAMFEEGGIAYVYFIYGVHFCFNVVTGNKGRGEAVLIRALEPLDGINIMRKNRRIEDIKNLTNGPGKLASALNIDKSLYGKDLTTSEIQIWEGSDEEFEIVETTRIGIKKSTDVIARFYIKGNSCVSKI